jgi:hypothetical protein
VTISGRGFPEKGFSPDDTLVVKVAGQPCEVLTSNYHVITCKTAPRPAGDAAKERDLNGWYAGMRGVQFDQFPRWAAPAGWLAGWLARWAAGRCGPAGLRG